MSVQNHERIALEQIRKVEEDARRFLDFGEENNEVIWEGKAISQHDIYGWLRWVNFLEYEYEARLKAQVIALEETLTAYNQTCLYSDKINSDRNQQMSNSLADAAQVMSTAFVKIQERISARANSQIVMTPVPAPTPESNLSPTQVQQPNFTTSRNPEFESVSSSESNNVTLTRGM
jgi:hypothetical protein